MSSAAARPRELLDAPPRPALSLVFPVCDEERNLEALLESALSIGSRIAADLELVIVDDGSRDRSAEIIDQWQNADVRIRVVRHPANRGYGAALRSGLKEARGELVFFSDADLQFELAEVAKLLEHTDDFDIVAGYRSPRRDPWPRRLLAWGWGCMIRALFGLQIRDIDCAFKVFRRRALLRSGPP